MGSSAGDFQCADRARNQLHSCFRGNCWSRFNLRIIGCGFGRPWVRLGVARRISLRISMVPRARGDMIGDETVVNISSVEARTLFIPFCWRLGLPMSQLGHETLPRLKIADRSHPSFRQGHQNLNIFFSNPYYYFLLAIISFCRPDCI